MKFRYDTNSVTGGFASFLESTKIPNKVSPNLPYPISLLEYKKSCGSFFIIVIIM